MAENKNVNLTTGEGILSFPHLFKPTKNDKGDDVYDVQFIIPKSDKASIRALMGAIREVGMAKWGDGWKQYRQPLRDGDKEANKVAEDGKTYGEKYPERLGCVFINARSSRPVGIYDRQRNVITDESEIYSGCKAKIALSFYTYNKSGNTGVGVGLNGVQKVGNGEQIGGGGKPSVDSMFDMLDDEDDLGLDEEFETEEEVEEAPAPKKRAAAKKAPAKKAAAKVEEIEVDEDEDDLFDDLDD